MSGILIDYYDDSLKPAAGFDDKNIKLLGGAAQGDCCPYSIISSLMIQAILSNSDRKFYQVAALLESLYYNNRDNLAEFYRNAEPSTAAQKLADSDANFKRLITNFEQLSHGTEADIPQFINTLKYPAKNSAAILVLSACLRHEAIGAIIEDQEVQKIKGATADAQATNEFLLAEELASNSFAPREFSSIETYAKYLAKHKISYKLYCAGSTANDPASEEFDPLLTLPLWYDIQNKNHWECAVSKKDVEQFEEEIAELDETRSLSSGSSDEETPINEKLTGLREGIKGIKRKNLEAIEKDQRFTKYVPAEKLKISTPPNINSPQIDAPPGMAQRPRRNAPPPPTTSTNTTTTPPGVVKKTATTEEAVLSAEEMAVQKFKEFRERLAKLAQEARVKVESKQSFKQADYSSVKNEIGANILDLVYEAQAILEPIDSQDLDKQANEILDNLNEALTWLETIIQDNFNNKNNKFGILDYYFETLTNLGNLPPIAAEIFSALQSASEAARQFCALRDSNPNLENDYVADLNKELDKIKQNDAEVDENLDSNLKARPQISLSMRNPLADDDTDEEDDDELLRGFSFESGKLGHQYEYDSDDSDDSDDDSETQKDKRKAIRVEKRIDGLKGKQFVKNSENRQKWEDAESYMAQHSKKYGQPKSTSNAGPSFHFPKATQATSILPEQSVNFEDHLRTNEHFVSADLNDSKEKVAFEGALRSAYAKATVPKEWLENFWVEKGGKYVMYNTRYDDAANELSYTKAATFTIPAVNPDANNAILAKATMEGNKIYEASLGTLRVYKNYTLQNPLEETNQQYEVKITNYDLMQAGLFLKAFYETFKTNSRTIDAPGLSFVFDAKSENSLLQIFSESNSAITKKWGLSTEQITRLRNHFAEMLEPDNIEAQRAIKQPSRKILPNFSGSGLISRKRAQMQPDAASTETPKRPRPGARRFGPRGG